MCVCVCVCVHASHPSHSPLYTFFTHSHPHTLFTHSQPLHTLTPSSHTHRGVMSLHITTSTIHRSTTPGTCTLTTSMLWLITVGAHCLGAFTTNMAQGCTHMTHLVTLCVCVCVLLNFNSLYCKLSSFLIISLPQCSNIYTHKPCLHPLNPD